VDDLLAFIAHVKGELQASGKPVPPVFGFAQSLGGLVTCYAATKVHLDGLVLHSALIDVEWTPVLR
jgi:alpha-beta hydrolase superfamily lysophospholipase